MQTRYRWFKIQPLTKLSLAKLSKAFQAKVYGKMVPRGFQIDSVRQDGIEGVYTERREFEETVSDPLGGTISIHRVAFDHLPFVIRSSDALIRVTNPNKLIRGFVEQIADALDYSVAITPIELDPLIWLNRLKNISDIVSVLNLRSLPFSVSNSMAGVIRLSGQGDVLNELSKLLGNRKVQVSNITIELRRGQMDCKFELRATGVAVIYRGSPEEVAGILGTTLISKSDDDQNEMEKKLFDK